MQKLGSWGIVAGASSGLGAAFAHALGARGVHVVGVARRQDVLDRTLAEVRSRHGVKTRGLVFDLASVDAGALLAEVCGELEVGIAIYNAALSPVGAFLDQATDELLRTVDVNVRGPLMLARAAAPPMVKRGRGALVFMSSLAGDQGTPRLSTYAATKAFNTILGEGLWHELRPHGIDVIASCAGAIRTPGYAEKSQDEAPGTLDPDDVAEQTLRALGHGPRVVPGATNRVASAMLRRLPRRAAVGIMARSTRDLS